MTYGQFRAFKIALHYGEFKVASEVCNDSIGAYDYCGSRGIDIRDDYTAGVMWFELGFELSEADRKELKLRYDDAFLKEFDAYECDGKPYGAIFNGLDIYTENGKTVFASEFTAE